MRDTDIYLPIFSSVYPYFNKGQIGLQWKLPVLQVVRRGVQRPTSLQVKGGPPRGMTPPILTISPPIIRPLPPYRTASPWRRT